MPSTRRIKATILSAIIAVLILIYVTSSPSTTRSSPFYTSTRDALTQREAEEADGKALENDDRAVQKRLREAEEKAKKAADKKGEEFHGGEIKSAAEKVKAEVDRGRAVGDDRGVARKNLKGGSEKVLMEAKGKIQREREEVEKKEESQTPEERKAEAELNYILKRSPSKFAMGELYGAQC